MTSNQHIENGFDAIIIGGGLVGLTAAIGLDSIGLRVAVVERGPMDAQLEAAFDGRASALAGATVRMLDALGIWQHLAGYSAEIREIRVSDGPLGPPSLLHLHFDHKDLKDQGVLGHMVENRHIRIGLFEALKGGRNINIVAPDTVSEMTRDEKSARVVLASGKTLEAPLVIAADGRGSRTRSMAGIRVSEWDYNQTGIVAAIRFEEDQCGIAHERFLPSGPFAILPLQNRHASLVWTEKTHLIEEIMGLAERAFTAEIQRRVGGFLGEIEVVGGRWAYPLSLSYAERNTDTRLALVGDAGHGIHPIAGQGLNLGLRDVAALLDVIADGIWAGQDIGSVTTLAAYSQWRHADDAALIAVTDVLNRLFSNNIQPFAAARQLGMGVIDRITPLKRFFMAHARGDLGVQPRLMRGMALR